MSSLTAYRKVNIRIKNHILLKLQLIRFSYASFELTNMETTMRLYLKS